MTTELRFRHLANKTNEMFQISDMGLQFGFPREHQRDASALAEFAFDFCPPAMEPGNPMDDR